MPSEAFDGLFGLAAEPLRTAHHQRGHGADLRLDLFPQLDRCYVGYAQIERDGIEVSLSYHSQCFAARAHRDGLDIAPAQDFPPVGSAEFVRRDDQQLLSAPLQRMMNGVESD